MPRPAKNSADFFSHDTGMRNHRKIKAIRNKFGYGGYGLWCMLLEFLTGADGNEFEKSDSEFELLAGDFGVSATEIRDVVDYCIRLELLFEQNGFIYSESLNERLAPVYLKRGKAKEISHKQRRVNGQYASSNTEPPGVSVAEMPHSKVEESKEEDSKGDGFPEAFQKQTEAFEYMKNNYQVIEDAKKTVAGKGWRGVDEVDIVGFIKLFISAKAKMDQPPKEIREHFRNWLFLQPVDKLTEYAATHKRNLK